MVKDIVEESKETKDLESSEIDDLLADVEVKADSLSMEKTHFWIYYYNRISRRTSFSTSLRKRYTNF